MNSNNIEEFYSRISVFEKKDIETHCREVHAGAVIHSLKIIAHMSVYVLGQLVPRIDQALEKKKRVAV